MVLVRLFRGLLVTLVLVVLFALVAEWALRLEAADRLEDRLQSAAELSVHPDVDVGSGVLLLQAVRGRYDHVAVDVPVVSRDGVVVEGLVVDLVGVHLSLPDLSGSDPVLVDRLSARGLVTFDSLASRLPPGAVLSADGDRLRLDATVDVLGVQVPVAASGVPVLDGRVLRFGELDLVLGGRTFSPAVLADLESRLASLAAVELPALPAGLQVVGLSPSRDGLAFRVSGEHVLVPRTSVTP